MRQLILERKKGTREKEIGVKEDYTFTSRLPSSLFSLLFQLSLKADTENTCYAIRLQHY